MTTEQGIREDLLRTLRIESRDTIDRDVCDLFLGTSIHYVNMMGRKIGNCLFPALKVLEEFLKNSWRIL